MKIKFIFISLLTFIVSSMCMAISYNADSTETDQGVTGSGGTIKALVDSIGNNTATIVLSHNSGTSTNYVFSTSETIPSNITLKFESGAKLLINSAATVTIYGPVEANLSQIFDGDGTLTFGKGVVSEFFAEWYGAVGNGSTDDYSAINRMMEAMPAGGVLRFLPKKYRIESPLVASQRISIRGTIPTEDQTAIIGAVLLKAGNFTTLTLNAGSSNIYGLIVDGATGNGGNGIHLRANSQTLTNVTVARQGGIGIVVGDPSVQRNCNHWQLRQVTARSNGSHGILIDAYDPGSGPDANGGFAYGLVCSFNDGDGLYINRAQVNCIAGISNEQNTGNGVRVGGSSRGNTFLNPHCEANDGEQFIFDSGSTNCLLIGSMVYEAVDNGNNVKVRATGGSNQKLCISRKIKLGENIYCPEDIVTGAGMVGYLPGLYFWDTNAGQDAKLWQMFSHTGNLVLRASSEDGLTDSDVIKFYRSGTDISRINVRQGKLLVTDGIGVGNSVSGDVTGTSKTKKIQVFDTNGVSIGYLQVYQGP